MKKLILLITVLGISIGCSSDEPKAPLPDIPKELIGKWKATEFLATTTGSDHYWVETDSGEIYDIWYKADGTYFINNSGLNEECTNGEYSVNDNFILSKGGCNDNAGKTRIVELTANYLETQWNAIEGGGAKFIKIE